VFCESSLRRRLYFRLSVVFIDVSDKNDLDARERLERGAVR
jgi:hypothetical protein